MKPCPACRGRGSAAGIGNVAVVTGPQAWPPGWRWQGCDSHNGHPVLGGDHKVTSPPSLRIRAQPVWGPPAAAWGPQADRLPLLAGLASTALLEPSPMPGASRAPSSPGPDPACGPCCTHPLDPARRPWGPALLVPLPGQLGARQAPPAFSQGPCFHQDLTGRSGQDRFSSFSFCFFLPWPPMP